MESPCAVAAYFSASLAMTTVNKYIVSVLRFPGMNLLLLLESAATSAAIACLSPNRCRPWEPAVMRNLSLVTLAKAANLVLNCWAMEYTSLPVYNVLKRLNIVFSVVADAALRGTTFSTAVLLAVSLITVGAFVTGSGDLEFSAFGYFIALPASVMNASYLVLAARGRDRVPGLGHIDLCFYTAFYNIFLFAPLAYFELEEVWRFLGREGLPLAWTWSTLLAYAVLGAFLNFAAFWCTAATSPVTTGVTGNFKAIFATWIGVVWFGSALNMVGWGGLLLSTAGGCLYSAATLLEGQRRLKAA